MGCKGLAARRVDKTGKLYAVDSGGTVKRFWARREDELASELRASRPEPSPDLIQAISRRVDASGRRARLYTASRLSFAGALTALMLGTLASFGGLSYAASGTKEAVIAAKQVVAPSRPQAGNTPARDQYEPQKITICHKGHTITISTSALPAHLRHGDTVGACPAGTGGVAGVSADRALGAQGQGRGTLPFTGISLGATMLVSLLLLALGLTLRRRADRKP